MPGVFWINECRKTWLAKDGTQKVHYSQQAQGKKAGSHSESIKVEEFLDFYKSLGRDDLDIMLEVKDKNLSAVRCIKEMQKLPG
jgi:UV DNA damage endonuclease